MLDPTCRTAPPPSSSPSARAPAINVLVVDDDPEFLDLLVTEIGQIPRVRITSARNRREALERLGDPSYKLVVTDWALDDAMGAEVLTKADDLMDTVVLSDKTPVLFISGSEKVNETHRLHTLRHFEPVSFVLKRCGPPMISRIAAHILERFHPPAGAESCPN